MNFSVGCRGRLHTLNIGGVEYALGERWYSYDDGVTWTRQHAQQPPGSALEVTKIDRTRGEITLMLVRP